MKWSGSHTTASGAALAYSVCCKQGERGARWAAIVFDAAGNVWDTPSGATVGVPCDDPLLQRLVQAAIADAINERQRILEMPSTD